MTWIAKCHTYSATATAAYGTYIGSYTENKTYAVLISNPVLFHCVSCVNISDIEQIANALFTLIKKCIHNCGVFFFNHYITPIGGGTE